MMVDAGIAAGADAQRGSVLQPFEQYAASAGSPEVARRHEPLREGACLRPCPAGSGFFGPAPARRARPTRRHVAAGETRGKRVRLLHRVIMTPQLGPGSGEVLPT